ncbi:MAG: Transcriptional regulatory protein zraR [Gammaproteobacteria bacterium]|jgi:FixJ family two-component response regulator|nr:Transcriptional regulatory protein zraR [Gammaproteobacteria bacterium]
MAKRNRQFFIAVVDDDAGMRAATRDLLKSNGFRTQGFSSAEQFLRSRHGREAACLVLDLRLPGMSGLELQRELCAGDLAIPTIVATAEDEGDGQVYTQLLQAGAMAVLHKPFDAEQLLRLVQTAVEARRPP